MTLAEPNFGGPAWKNLAKSKEQKSYFDKGMDGVGCLRHPGGTPYKRHIVHVNDVVHAFLRALGNPRALGETFHIAAPSAFSYDVLARYTAEKLKLPVVDFELDGFYDFEIHITKARTELGYEPGYDVFRMADEAIEFRRSGGKRTAGGRRG
jgi:nucleoside-diphosphate-sugar epimerase